MSPNEKDEQEDTISVADMRSTLDRETREVMRAADLRIREISQLTQAYIAGEISPIEASSAYVRHMDKWGDSFPGVARSTAFMSDEEIMADMDRAVQSHSSRVQAGKQSQQNPRKL